MRKPHKHQTFILVLTVEDHSDALAIRQLSESRRAPVIALSVQAAEMLADRHIPYSAIREFSDLPDWIDVHQYLFRQMSQFAADSALQEKEREQLDIWSHLLVAEAAPYELARCIFAPLVTKYPGADYLLWQGNVDLLQQDYAILQQALARLGVGFQCISAGEGD